MIIAVDASGGEYAPHEIVKGAIKAAQDFKIGIALVGKKEILHVQARRYMKELDISIVDAPEYIDDAESPIEAVTKKQNSSIVVGTMMVKTGKADAFVSAGSTGAVMFAAFAMLGRVEGIERPAIGSIITINITSPFPLLDCGANPNCRPKHLYQFAQMGNIYVKEVFGVAKPRIALLNNGEEEKKGNTLRSTNLSGAESIRPEFCGQYGRAEPLQGHGRCGSDGRVHREYRAENAGRRRGSIFKTEKQQPGTFSRRFHAIGCRVWFAGEKNRLP